MSHSQAVFRVGDRHDYPRRYRRRRVSGEESAPRMIAPLPYWVSDSRHCSHLPILSRATGLATRPSCSFWLALIARQVRRGFGDFRHSGVGVLGYREQLTVVQARLCRVAREARRLGGAEESVEAIR
jgi:hypothetical protein